MSDIHNENESRYDLHLKPLGNAALLKPLRSSAPAVDPPAASKPIALEPSANAPTENEIVQQTPVASEPLILGPMR